jgi:hypothetical protein
MKPTRRSWPTHPARFSRSFAERERASHEHRCAQIEFLASHGHLTPFEIEQIAAEGKAAKARLDTPAERKAFNCEDAGGDRLAAELAEVVAEALAKGASR